MEYLSIVPLWSINYFQKLLRKMGSLSDTMPWGKPWNLTTLSTNTLATLTAINPCFKGEKWATLVNLSTTTEIVVYPNEGGNLIIKSIMISDQGTEGIGSGCSKPEGLAVLHLVCWHVRHAATYSVTCCLRPSQLNCSTIQLYVFNTAVCPLWGLSWNSRRTRIESGKSWE